MKNNVKKRRIKITSNIARGRQRGEKINEGQC
jgi:hypothetical protein